MKKLACVLVASIGLLTVGVFVRLFYIHTLDASVTDLKSSRGQLAVNRLHVTIWIGDRRALVLAGNAYAYGWGGLVRNRVLAELYLARADSECSAKGSKQMCGLEEEAIAKAYAAGENGVPFDETEARHWSKVAKLRKSVVHGR
jgi:hypothetical protein